MINEVFNPQFLATVTAIAAVILAATQVVKKAIESAVKKPLAMWVSISVSFIVSVFVCFPRITTDGFWMYTVYVLFGFITANGWFKIVKSVAPTPPTA